MNIKIVGSIKDHMKKTSKNLLISIGLVFFFRIISIIYYNILYLSGNKGYEAFYTFILLTLLYLLIIIISFIADGGIAINWK